MVAIIADVLVQFTSLIVYVETVLVISSYTAAFHVPQGENQDTSVWPITWRVVHNIVSKGALEDCFTARNSGPYYPSTGYQP